MTRDIASKTTKSNWEWKQKYNHRRQSTTPCSEQGAQLCSMILSPKGRLNKKKQQIMLWLLPVEFFFVQIFRTSKSRIHCFSIFGVILFVFVSTKVTSNDKIHVKSNWMISFKCACIFAWPKVISAKRPIFPSPKPISVIIFLTYVFKLLPYCVLMMIGSTELKIRHIRRFFMFLLWSSRLPVHCVSDQNAIEIINVFELRRALDYTVLKCLRPHTSKWQT